MFEFNLQVNYWMDLNAKKSDNNEIFFSFLLDDFDQSCEYFFWEWAECGSTQLRLRIFRQFLIIFFDCHNHPQKDKDIECGFWGKQIPFVGHSV